MSTDNHWCSVVSYGTPGYRDAGFNTVGECIKANTASPTSGGRPLKNQHPKWQCTNKRVTTRDGIKRVLYKNPSMPGDLRVRKFRTQANGKKIAFYVKP
jgi:hypothetical protein